MYKQNTLSHFVSELMKAEKAYEKNTRDRDQQRQYAKYLADKNKHDNDAMIKLYRGCTF